MAFRIVSSLRLQAVRATFAALPTARRRSSNPLSTGLYRPATSVLTGEVARTGARPPHTVLVPRRVPRGYTDQRGDALALLPGLAISIAVLAFNPFGDMLRDILDPRSRNGSA
jgi:hypothetical protein